MLSKVLTVVYKQGTFDLACSCRMPKYTAALYSSSSPGRQGENFVAPEEYALDQEKDYEQRLQTNPWNG